MGGIPMWLCLLALPVVEVRGVVALDLRPAEVHQTRRVWLEVACPKVEVFWLGESGFFLR